MEPLTPPDQHDTVVLSTHPPRPVAPAATRQPAPPSPPAPRSQPALGWQQVSDWRGTVAHQAPSAWSQVPPFIPAAAPPVLVMRNNAAVVGATLGSVSLFLALIPLIGIVSLVLAPIGLISSGAGLLVGLSRRVGRAGAIWGLLTSSLALLVCMAWTALFLAF